MCGFFLITVIFDGCHRSSAAVTPVKYDRDIQYTTSVLTMFNNRQNNGTLTGKLV